MPWWWPFGPSRPRRPHKRPFFSEEDEKPKKVEQHKKPHKPKPKRDMTAHAGAPAGAGCLMKRGSCLSIRGKGDGFGAQLLAFLSGWAHCEWCGCEYAHVRISSIYLSAERGKAYDTNMEGAVKEGNRLIEELFLPFFVDYHDETPEKCVEYAHLHARNRANASVIYSDYITSLFRAAWPTENPWYFPLQKYYRPKPSPSNPYALPVPIGDHYLRIAVHVRRHDIKQGSMFRWQSDEVIEKCLHEVGRKFQPHQFHVFSWAEPPKFKTLQNVTHHIGNTSDTFDTFNAFVHADVLVVGRSSFSTAAGTRPRLERRLAPPPAPDRARTAPRAPSPPTPPARVRSALPPRRPRLRAGRRVDDPRLPAARYLAVVLRPSGAAHRPSMRVVGRSGRPIPPYGYNLKTRAFEAVETTVYRAAYNNQ